MRFGLSRILLCAPFFLTLAAFWLFPLGESLLLSLRSDTLFGDSTFVGLDHYRELAVDDRFHKAAANTVVYTLATSCLAVFAAVLLAFGVRLCWPGIRGPLTFCLMLPGLCPPTVMAFLFLLVFHGDEGVLNKWIIRPMGFETIQWLSDPRFIMPALIIQATWRWSGFMAFFLGCAMDAVPRSLNEAAELDGAGRIRRFWHVSIPLIRPTLTFCLLYMGIDCVSQFAGSYVLLGGSGGTNDAGLLLVSYAYQRGFTFGEFGSGAAVGISAIPFLAGLLLLLAFLPRVVVKRGES